MTKLKQFSRNLAKRGLLLSFLLVLFFFCGCTSSTEPTYIKEKTDSAIQEICKSEYQLDIKAKLVGDALYIYLPVEDIFVNSDKPEKITQIFKVEEPKGRFINETLELDYFIKSQSPQEQMNPYSFNKKVTEKIQEVWRVIRRVTSSLKHEGENEPKFICIITADIKSGFEIKTINYYLDLKKIFYSLISGEEFHHRTIQDTNIDPKIIGDKDGAHVEYKDITMEEFVIGQIKQRIKLKFQKPELDKSADIDKEILKIVINTIKIYDFREFNSVELYNIITGNKLMLNKAAVLAGTIEQKF